MPRMYFSGEDSNNITFDEPTRNCIEVDPMLFTRVQNDEEQNVRVFLDTHLLKIRSRRGLGERAPGKLVSKSHASINVGLVPDILALAYITDAMVNAEFREMSSEEFKSSYLAPLETTIRESKFAIRPLAVQYTYPSGNSRNVGHHIQKYFNEICRPIENLYQDICCRYHYFESASYLRPPLNTDIFIEPDIIHFAEYKSEDGRFPEICFGLGDYKTENYYLGQGFEEFKVVLKGFKQKDQQKKCLFPDIHWNPSILFALVLSKYFYNAFLCGTNRVFISNHQSFSGFFRYDIVEGQMSVDYYIISDPETVADGITLRSAIASFFYQTEDGAIETRNKLKTYLGIAHNANKLDPLRNVRPKSHRQTPMRSSESKYVPLLYSIYEDADHENIQVIQDIIYGNTYCRVIYNSAKCYPKLTVNIPSTVFVKLYYFSRRLQRENDLTCFGIPDRKGYYSMFFNELEINEEIAKSRFASNFPKLFVSGYWNDFTNQPIHIFEYLGKEIPREKWDKKRVYEVTRLRLKELHSLRISHNDIRKSNIHVSESGKITLVDFGLSEYPCSEAGIQDDFDSLDNIFGVNSSANKKQDVGQTNTDRQKSQVVANDKAKTSHSDEGDETTSSDFELAEMSFELHDTKTTTTTK
ncbi:DEHA2F26576p [Debaryomyces hansenii CBS767]|uniref:DEHA2F26576p n=1 Tax=Debaryomyces hansenii (strain ATCC 36239 / CBS 767 / BCRC 21394 / JCM 1990 / NBRC 0083 / IGC 2968) TaxID=284592 RepID=Q6BJX7_DEBHA|nr:DEHA2F26576p [Debaryomyces hansenii CBS767]CAG89920.2 DEHA2F26576p [Debaryomyces hansenii CBS767]|eukprot:XP_461494.2 DEHA2F26576p [Debaryomyces hansenii CBS767]